MIWLQKTFDASGIISPRCVANKTLWKPCCGVLVGCFRLLPCLRRSCELWIVRIPGTKSFPVVAFKQDRRFEIVRR